MRVKIELTVQPDTLGICLPINYQYELSSAIYHILDNEWLHDHGFVINNKRVKLFTFSNLIIDDIRLNKKEQLLIIKSNKVYLYVSILPQDIFNNFVNNLITKKTLQVSNKKNGVEFAINKIEVLPDIIFEDDMIYETISPICISLRKRDGSLEYLSPSSSCYLEGIKKGLMACYEVYYNKPYNGEYFCDFKILDEPKSVLVKIKSDTPQQIFVRGYKYRFQLRLPIEIMKVAYEKGLGEKGSMGFGMFKPSSIDI